jgi:putative membrane protein
MKTRRIILLMPVMLLLTAPCVFAADSATPTTWHAQTLLQAVGNVVLFAIVGVIAAIVGFKIFDKCTPGHLGREIVEHRNVAAAIIGAAVILGVCIIVAASIMG